MEEKKVVRFAQSESKAKEFRQDYPLSEELRRVMVNETTGDLMKYAVEQYFRDFYPFAMEYVEDHMAREEKMDALILNLFWWRLLYHTDDRNHVIESYIAENFQQLRKKPIILAWLREWKKAVPKFYHIGYKHNDRVLVVTDILEEKTLDVIVYDPSAIPPIRGEIVMGTLIPIGDGLYFPIIDFYHFDYEAREAIASCIHQHYDTYLKNSTMQDALIHVLSIMLQIERMLFLERQENTPII